MVKKITIELYVEPLTTAGDYNNFKDNVDEFVAVLAKNGLSNIGEESYDLEIVGTEVRRD